MKVAFLGYGEIGATVLGPLAAQHDVAAVVTHRPEFGGLGEGHVATLAHRHGLRTLFADDLATAPGVAGALTAAAPEVLVSANWRTRVPEDVLAIPSLCPLNIHDALLPDYAGFGSVNWSIRNGETAIGLTVHIMERDLDTGPVVHTVTVPIAPHDTATTVYSALLKEYPHALLTALERVATGATPTPQRAGGSFYHRITEADTRIDWTQPTTRILDLVRAQSDPFVNAWCLLDGRKLYIKTAVRPTRAHRGTPGRVIAHTDGGVAVVCGHSWSPDADGIILRQVQRPDQPAGPATDILVPRTRLS
ncbi:methionyl-tRNA formyltransferase [Nocardia suismassiliense]|uniref:methionyl-tRNA formyltransferase n=1 Tax=Nocardia suismassiliense TaxID=2077092 RepID=UPI00131F04D9|nr:methionyl-tRNA formyltransferase [Nocardia suismassiliense]